MEVVAKSKTFVTFASIDFMPWFEVKLDMHRQQNISAFQNNAACLTTELAGAGRLLVIYFYNLCSLLSMSHSESD